MLIYLLISTFCCSSVQSSFDVLLNMLSRSLATTESACPVWLLPTLKTPEGGSTVAGAPSFTDAKRLACRAPRRRASETRRRAASGRAATRQPSCLVSRWGRGRAPRTYANP